MPSTAEHLEQQRLALQAQRDEHKTSADRNRLGQYGTPTDLARDILQYAVSLLAPDEPIRFLDPAIGTGAFYSALLATCPNGRVAEAVGFEIDPHYGLPSSELWSGSPIKYTLADFTRQKPDPRHNLIICNPPYVRHHHLAQDEKLRLQHQTLDSSGMKLSGLAGLYCHFLGLSHAWMAEGGIAGWLIPSEFMDVNYGQAVKQYLLDTVTLLHIHRFDPDDVQFADALVSSAIVWFRKTPPLANDQTAYRVKFTFGGSLHSPNTSRMIPVDVLRREPKWTRFPRKSARQSANLPTVGDLFKIKRGIATGGNKFFILPEADARRRQLPPSELTPILPSPRYVTGELVEADDRGYPLLERRLYLLDTRLSEAEIACRYPALWSYLEEGCRQGVHKGYICSHRPLWYTQDDRPPPPIVCTYLGRGRKDNGRPFRFIRNRSRATVANVYLAMYPTPALQRAANENPTIIDRLWRMLNQLDTATILGESRVYGGGLHKLEPKELANVPITDFHEILPKHLPAPNRDTTLFDLAAESATAS